MRTETLQLLQVVLPFADSHLQPNSLCLLFPMLMLPPFYRTIWDARVVFEDFLVPLPSEPQQVKIVNLDAVLDFS